MTDDDLPEEYARVWKDAQADLDKLKELAPDGGATKTVIEATDALDASKKLTLKAQRIKEDTDNDG